MKTVEYPNLLDQTRRAFGEEVPAGVKFYYLDEENELVSISSQNDLEEALDADNGDFVEVCWSMTESGHVEHLSISDSGFDVTFEEVAS